MIDSIVLIYGLLIGSFLNVLIYRLPKNISLINPKRSFCPNCNHQISWKENIPLASFILQKGKCLHCKTSISKNYFIVELLSSILTWFVYLKFGLGSEFFITIILIYLLIVLSFIDFEYKAVPDYLLVLILLSSIFIPNFSFLSALLFAGAFALLNFIITFYIQNIKARLTKNKDLEEQVALGEGDIPIITLIGGILGIKLGIVAIFLAALFAIFPALYGTIAKKEIETPFIPYLSLGFIVVFFGENFIISILREFGI